DHLREEIDVVFRSIVQVFLNLGQRKDKAFVPVVQDGGSSYCFAEGLRQLRFSLRKAFMVNPAPLHLLVVLPDHFADIGAGAKHDSRPVLLNIFVFSNCLKVLVDMLETLDREIEPASIKMLAPKGRLVLKEHV